MTTILIILGPWFYGSWEMWWFWPMACIIFLATGCFALRMLLLPAKTPVFPAENRRTAYILFSSYAVFLAYALLRLLTTEVYMNAERSFLLHFLPFLVGINIVIGFSREQKNILYMLIVVDLLVLGVYGVANHFITGNEYVLFTKGYKQYIADNRATGSYFCPDHFSGIMELAFCICIATLITRKHNWKTKLFSGIMLIIAFAGVILSKSRGGGMTVIVILLATLIWGLSQLKNVTRWYYRVISLAFLALLILLFMGIDSGYTKRFKSYFTTNKSADSTLSEKAQNVGLKLRRTARGHMFAGAYNAWKTAPIVGIGPGMHQNLWPHFANSLDGNREIGKWPTHHKLSFGYSYEVHNDWLQLLEEYGIIGVLLFCLPAYVTFRLLLRSRKIDHTKGLAAVLAVACMAFHSLGDFNLQMPATGWMLAAIIAFPLSDYLKSYSSDSKS